MLRLLQKLKKFPPPQHPLTVPVRLGYFSCSNNTIHFDDSSMRVLKRLEDKNAKLDLTEGNSKEIDHSESVNMNSPPSLDNVELDSSNEHADGDEPFRETHNLKVLSWVSKNGKCIVPSGNSESSKDPDKLEADFVCDANVLEQIMETPLNGSTSWTVTAVKLDGVIYLTTNADPLPREMKEMKLVGEGDDLKEVEVHHDPYTDYRLKQLMTAKEKGSNDSFHLVNTVNVNKLKILYSSKVDCAASQKQVLKPIERVKFFIIRTIPEAASDAMKLSLTLSWWISIFLSTCGKVVVGYKETGDTINGLMFNRPRDLARAHLLDWTPREVAQYLDSMLRCIRRNVPKELKPIAFHRNVKYREITCQPLKESPFSFIPSWYVDEIVSRKTGSHQL